MFEAAGGNRVAALHVLLCDIIAYTYRGVVSFLLSWVQMQPLFQNFIASHTHTPPPPLDSVMISSANKILEAKGMIHSILCMKFCWHHSCLHDRHSENKKTALQDHGEDGQEFTPTQCSRAQSYIAALQPIRGPANLGVTLLLAASKR